MLDGFSRKFIFELLLYLMNNCRENSSFLKYDKNKYEFTRRPMYFYYNITFNTL